MAGADPWPLEGFSHVLVTPVSLNGETLSKFKARSHNVHDRHRIIAPA